MALDDKKSLSGLIEFSLNGQIVTAGLEETIWQVAQKQGVEIPHLCWKNSPGYRADGIVGHVWSK